MHGPSLKDGKTAALCERTNNSCPLACIIENHFSTCTHAGLQAVQGIHHCPGSNAVHMPRLLEDGLWERVWGGCDAVRPGGEWKGSMHLQMIFPMQSGCKSYNSKLKGSGPPLPLLGQAVSHCFIGDYITISPLGDVKFETSLPCRRCATSTGLLGTPGGGRSLVNSMCLFSKSHSRMVSYSACSVSPTPR